MIDAHIAPEMQKTMQAVAAAGGDMTKVNGERGEKGTLIASGFIAGGAV